MNGSLVGAVGAAVLILLGLGIVFVRPTWRASSDEWPLRTVGAMLLLGLLTLTVVVGLLAVFIEAPASPSGVIAGLLVGAAGIGIATRCAGAIARGRARPAERGHLHDRALLWMLACEGVGVVAVVAALMVIFI